METDLNPCPFCGGHASYPPAVVEYASPWTSKIKFVNCENCGAVGPSDRDEAQAIAQWNTRAQPVPVTGKPSNHSEGYGDASKYRLTPLVFDKATMMPAFFWDYAKEKWIRIANSAASKRDE